MSSQTLHIDGDLAAYTKEEILQIQAVLNSLFFGKKPSKESDKRLVLTGGYPGAGKSNFAHQFERMHGDFIRVDVNDNCLFVIPGYQRDYLEKGPEAAYEKWRAASNWISQQATKKALDEGYNLLLVGTATSPFILDLIKQAKQKKYSTEFHGFAAPVEICLKRNKPENRFSYLEHTGGVSFLLPENHVTEKRPLFDKALPALVRNVDRAYMNWNPRNTKAPSLAFRSAAVGEEEDVRVIICNPSATKAFMNCAGWKKQPDTPLLPALAYHLGIKL